MSNVFIAFQTNEETRPIVEAIVEDNPGVLVDEQPAMVRLSAPGSLTIRRQTIEDKMGRDFNLQEMQINLITLSGHVDEDDDQFTLSWNS